MSRKITIGIIALAIAALPAAAAASKPDGAGGGSGKNSQGEGHGKAKGPKKWTVEVHGTVSAVSGNVVTLTVKKANHHGAGIKGKDVQFDLTNAKLHVRDVNGDGKRDINDVSVGDKGDVQARLPKKPTADDLATPFPARKANFRHPKSTTSGGGSTDEQGGDSSGPATG